ncbi:MAG: hypothetical protein HY716_14470 [Planctomycetes bacterium]|nr:hypothetical protein [Planctomycetota bacterium]
MKRQVVYKRQIKTARRFIFENIMDLDHVCVLHRKWFTHLRTLVRRPDYVEYRLRGWFYGLKQDMRFVGASVDENRYWYEFVGPWVKVRVEGEMEGPDGNLLLTERFTYRFHWLTAPIFWFLGPLFKKQKENILEADSRLLERVYRLDQAGFKRFSEQG